MGEENVAALLREGMQALAALDEGAQEAGLLLAHALGRSRSWLYAHGDDLPDAAGAVRYRQCLQDRLLGTPVAYLTGSRGFWSLQLEVTPATLIPRPETERLVELALERLPRDARLDVVDLGTGSGAIALAIAAERPRARVVAVDASADALQVARRNAFSNSLQRVEFLHGSWWSPLGGRRFHLVLSNPPYIADDDRHLGEGDLRFEPRMALASGADGLDAIRCILAGVPAHLHAGGWLLVEHGWQQGRAVRDLFENAGLIDVSSATDLEDRERVTLGRLRDAAGT
jgi:release factor glutamine methyltransferase